MFGLFDMHYNEFKPEQTLLGSAGKASTFDTNQLTIEHRNIADFDYTCCSLCIPTR